MVMGEYILGIWTGWEQRPWGFILFPHRQHCHQGDCTIKTMDEI